jgi:hypothetical protein
MDHSLSISGYNTRLRPVEIANAEFILGLRTIPRVIGKVGDTVPAVSEQRRWIQDYFKRCNDYYFIIDSLENQPWGTIGIYSFTAKRAEWGRWFILPDIMATLPSGTLAHQLAFEHFDAVWFQDCRAWCSALPVTGHDDDV